MKITEARRRLTALAAGVILGLSVPFLAASPASAAAELPGTINGPGGVLNNATAQLFAFPATSLNPNPVTTAHTSDGQGYKFTDVAPGKYQIRFIPPTNTWIAPAWSAETPSGGSTFRSEARVFVVGSTTTSLPIPGVTLSATGSISGKVPGDWKVNAQLWNPNTAQFEQTLYQVTMTAAGNTRPTYAINGLPPGEYLVRFEPKTIGRSATYWSSKTRTDDAIAVTVTAGDTTSNIDEGVIQIFQTFHRIAGTNRYDGSAQMSQVGFPTPDTVFITNGTNFPDGLAAAPAAAALGAPLLLTDPASLPSQIATEIERIKPKTIVIVGGTSSVSSGVETQIRNLSTVTTSITQEVIRIEGSNRYDVARKLARYAFSGYDNHTAFLVTGADFPDGIAAGSAAAALHAPVLLDNGGSSVDAATADILADLGIERVVIVGGTGGVTSAMETDLRTEPGITSVIRVAGANRYDTAVQAYRLASPYAADTIILTSGVGYTDALSGITLAGAWGAPMLLSETSCLRPDVIDQIEAYHPREIQILGGNNTLGVGMENLSPCY